MKPKGEVVVVEKDGVIHFVPKKPIRELRGFVKGVTTDDLRDEEDRF